MKWSVAVKDLYRCKDHFDLSPSTRKRKSQSVEKLGDKVRRKFSFEKSSSTETNTIVSCKHSPEDCFTMEKINSPSDPEKRALSWSQYEKCNTVKYLISATPYGFINIISSGFGRRSTDVIIVEKSGFLEDLPNVAHVMAERGFKQIPSLLAPKHCKLFKASSVITSEICSKEQVEEGKQMAAPRIHIERVIRRLRLFKTLKMHSCINHKMFYLLDPMIITACGIMNLPNPII
ncbi:hypothetical protein JTB14_001722 [Gonioctena quinquepunctata]|nr:hypothetical protein JTB14_001722 [Gonioctena quinquepunctata]